MAVTLNPFVFEELPVTPDDGTRRNSVPKEAREAAPAGDLHEGKPARFSALPEEGTPYSGDWLPGRSLPVVGVSW